MFSQDFTIAPGYNKLFLSQPLKVPKGSLIYLKQGSNGTTIAVDQITNSSFSDLIWGTNLLKLNNLTQNNWRFYLNPITNNTNYQSNLNIIHYYTLIGVYEISLLFTSSNKIFKHIINVTDCKKLTKLYIFKIFSVII